MRFRKPTNGVQPQLHMNEEVEPMPEQQMAYDAQEPMYPDMEGYPNDPSYNGNSYQNNNYAQPTQPVQNQPVQNQQPVQQVQRQAPVQQPQQAVQQSPQQRPVQQQTYQSAPQEQAVPQRQAAPQQCQQVQSSSYHGGNRTQQTYEQSSSSYNNNGGITKILPKFVMRPRNAQKGSAVEFSTSAFSLYKKDNRGNRDSYDTKLLMNFWTFDLRSNHMLDKIPTYIDVSEWLAVCEMILSPRLDQLTNAERKRKEASGDKYYKPIYQKFGGSYSAIFRKDGQQYGGGQNPTAVVFKIIPGMRDESWVISTEMYPGKRAGSGLIEVQPGSRPISRILVPFSRDDIVRTAKMSEMVIQAHFNALAMGLM